MSALERDTPPRPQQAAEPSRRREASALWGALRAERRARDERTARLRAMLSAVGEDAAG